MMENIFDVCCHLVQEANVCSKFVDAEGIELMLIMIRLKTFFGALMI